MGIAFVHEHIAAESNSDGVSKIVSNCKVSHLRVVMSSASLEQIDSSQPLLTLFFDGVSSQDDAFRSGLV